MADNVNVSNAPSSSNPDIPVRTSEVASGTQIQHVRIDLGSGTSESVASGSIPISGTVTVDTSALATEATLASIDSKITACDTSSIAGSITANAGTDLNTSALALESGGNLAAIAAKDFATQTTLAAVLAGQLPDGHNVTVDNAAGVAAVNVQDGGNSLTVDGTVAVSSVAGTVTVSDGGGSLTVDGSVAVSSVGGTVAVSDGGGSLTVDGAVSVSSVGGTVTVSDGGGSLTVDGTVSVNQPVAVTDNSGSLTVDDGGSSLTVDGAVTVSGTVAATQSGTWNIGTVTSITNEGQLVDNAAFTDGSTRLTMSGHILDETAGTALTENDAAASRIDSKRAQVMVVEDATTRGRRATVTATGAQVVDGSGVTQPVSGTVTANAGTNLNTSALALESGGNLASAATKLSATGASAQQVQGVETVGGVLVGKPLAICGKELFTGTQQELTLVASGGINYLATLIPDLSLNFLAYSTSGEMRVEGRTAHDSADASNPLKVGGKARDYEPDTSGVACGGLAEVDEDDRANLTTNRWGQAIVGVNPYFFTLDNVSTTYNNVTTTATSTAKECWNYRQATISFELTKANSPTDILIEVEISLNAGSTYTVLQNDFLGDLRESAASIGTGGIKKSFTFPIACHSLRVKTTATGTTSTATITMANACIYFRD